MTDPIDNRRDFVAIIQATQRVSAELGSEVEEVLRAGREAPLPRDESMRLLTAAVEVLRRGADRRGDKAASASLLGRIEEVIAMITATSQRMGRERVLVPLSAHNGISPRPVHPKPCFHGLEVPMNAGFVNTRDIGLWDENERLEIHLGQFQQKFGRPPRREEVLDIMLSKMKLPGIPAEDSDDQFQIVQLARSIAVNGVRKPPIIDTDGTLLDGNRRVAACYYILHSDEFDSEQKKRAETVFVWQLTEHTTDDERNAVVVSLNFEPDCKQDWPDYVKARKVYVEWQAMLALEPRVPSPTRQAEMKRELSKKYALGPDTAVVNRYLKMVGWANEFEEFHVGDRRRDKYEVKHRANKYFQYFDELAKGASDRSRGVAYTLERDEPYKHLVFDLLFDGKFKNWRQIRDLKFIAENEEARDLLRKAQAEPDPEVADDHIDNAIAIARSRSAEERQLGANTRIETFVRWLEQLPVIAFRDQIKPDNLERLLKALQLVEAAARTNLGTTAPAQE